MIQNKTLKPTVLICTYGTGGTEIIQKLQTLLNTNQEINFKIISCSKFSDRILNQTSTQHTKNIEIIQSHNNINRTLSLIQSHNPTAIINETSNGVEFQNHITKFCNDNDIPTISLLDINGSYKQRYKQVPRYILVPNKLIKHQLLCSIQTNKTKVIVTGNPTFQNLQKAIPNLINLPTIHMASSSNQINILYISQGRTTLGMLTQILQQLKQINIPYQLTIRPHPQEDNLYNFQKLLKFHNNPNLKVSDNSTTPLTQAQNYDLIIGKSSTIMAKTKILNIPTIYLQKGKIPSDIIDILKKITPLNKEKLQTINQIQCKQSKTNNLNPHNNSIQTTYQTILQIINKYRS